MRPAKEPLKRALGYVSSGAGPAGRSADAGELRRRIGEVASANRLELLEIVHEPSNGEDPHRERTGTREAVLLELLERAKRGEFDVLILGTRNGTWNESTKRAFLELRLRQYGVELECTIGGGGEEPTVDVARDVLSAADELERALLVRQLRAGKARKKALGRHVHGRLPYGYQSDRGMLRPVRSLAPIVIRIFSEAARGSSPGQIARGLNEEGIPTPQGGRAWSEQSVRVVLANPVYVGERYGVRDAHPAVVDRRVWNRAQKALRSRRRG